MSLIVAGSTQSLQIVLSAAIATNQLALSASWADQGATLGAQSIASNNTTAVTLVPAPSGATPRVVSSISICNTDTAAATVTLSRVTSGTPSRLLKVTLAAGYQLIYGAGRWEVLDASGVLQSAGSGGGGGAAWGAITGTLASQTDLVAALLSAQTNVVGVNDQTGTTYTFVLTDNGKDVRCTNGSAIAATIPPNSSVAFPMGAMIALSQGGAGVITVTAGAGVTLHAGNGVVTTGQYDARVLEKIGTDTWRVW